MIGDHNFICVTGYAKDNKITEDKIKADNEKAERLRKQNEELNKYKNSTVVQEVEGFLGSRNIHDLEDVLEKCNKYLKF